MYDEKALLEFRTEKDKAWKNDSESPLTEKQKEIFTGLKYFPPSPKFHFSLSLNKDIKGVDSKVVILTTDGDEQVYLKAGKIRFEIQGKQVEAIVFEDPEQEQYQYYLLFRDETTGKETYENGRMLQIEKDPSTSSPRQGSGQAGQEDKLIIDFNYAYNPYSSYNDNWGCPITPKENYLPLRIEAGEKKYH